MCRARALERPERPSPKTPIDGPAKEEILTI
jgi:hypothetical protein